MRPREETRPRWTHAAACEVKFRAARGKSALRPLPRSMAASGGLATADRSAAAISSQSDARATPLIPAAKTAIPTPIATSCAERYGRRVLLLEAVGSRGQRSDGQGLNTRSK